jgi:hypothetical protein
MGNANVISNGVTFDAKSSKNFLVLDKGTKPGFFKHIVKKSQYNLPTDASSLEGVTPITKDSQVFEVAAELNWLVLGPIILVAVLLLFTILYYAMRHQKPAYSP